MLALVMVAACLVVAAALVPDPAGALADLAQTSTDSPEAQDVAGDGAFRYRVLAGALFLLSLLLTGLALVCWRATTPPGKRMQRR
jgi:hypothetical protein